MFTEFVESTAAETGRKKWAMVMSATSQTGALLALLLAPFIYTQALPAGLLNIKALVAAPIPLVPSLKPPKVSVQNVKFGVRLLRGNILYQPKGFPPHAVVFSESELPPELPADNDAANYNATSLFSLLSNARNDAPPAPVPAPAPIQRIRQTQIQQAMILAQPQPAYPAWLRAARIQGDVVLHAIIDREGRVAELQVISGHPALAQAALAAVQNWRYRPTLLNGEPVEVETTITVSFVLGG
jgi:protein TonB